MELDKKGIYLQIQQKVRRDLPVQVIPSPVKPALQVHVLVPPITLVHCAFAEHPPLLAEHSLMSSNKITGILS